MARTWLTTGRLSEDIDLYAQDRAAIASALEAPHGLVWALRREFPDLTWAPPLGTVRDVEPAFLRAGSLVLRIQLLRGEGGYELWPTETRELFVRYQDCRPAHLVVPTRSAFIAMKTLAWVDRSAPRDLWDLSEFARLGPFDLEAAELVRRVGGFRIADHMFAQAPSELQWREALVGQTVSVGDPAIALAEVRTAWSLLD